MDCQIRRTAEFTEMVLVGSLDSGWSSYLSDRFDEVVRGGALDVRVDMAGVSYLSSNGIGLLVRYHRQLREIGGRLRIVAESDTVEHVLRLTGVLQFLHDDGLSSASGRSPVARSEAIERHGMALQVFLDPRGGRVERLELMGDPSRLPGRGYLPADEQPWRAAPANVALGLGALGPSFDVCRGRFGEFLGVAGVAAYRPSAGPGRPDFEQAASDFVPSVRVLYGLAFPADCPAVFRFDAKGEPGAASVGLSRIAAACLDLAGAGVVGIVLAGETDGLVGAALRRSPVGLSGRVDPFEHPEIRDWLSLTPEPEHTRSTALIVGVATREPRASLAPFVRPLDGPAMADLQGHFHAAVVPYRPLPGGAVELSATVAHLFEPGRIETILHLLGDPRPIVGAGESTFTRGVVWYVSLAVEGEAMLAMTLVVGTWTVGLILALLALGVFISFRIFAFPDITADGSLTLGAAVAAALIVHGYSPWTATAASMLAGAFAGGITGVLHARFKINGLLAGILVATALYSVNLHVMGRSNISLMDARTVGSDVVAGIVRFTGPVANVRVLGRDVPFLDAVNLVLAGVLVAALAGLLRGFLGTGLGTSMRATGDNPRMIRAMGVDVGRMIILGLMMSNAMVALSGALLAQYLGYADSQMGLGMIVWGLASVILGQALVGSGGLSLSIAGAVMGSLLFRLMVALALKLRLPAEDLKLITAVFVFVALVVPQFLAARARRPRPRPSTTGGA